MTDFSTGEVAEKMKVHPNTVLYWIDQGWLEAGRRGPSPRSPKRITQEQLNKFIQEHPDMVMVNNGS